MVDSTKIYYGSGHEDPPQHVLSAGPLKAIFQNGSLRAIAFNNTEFIQLIYWSVRDQFWNSILPKIESLHIENDSNSFHLRFTSRHERLGVDFLCDGEISGSSDGSITFCISGKAESSFLRNRIGFCVLHPLSLKTRKCLIEHSDGTQKEHVFPELIDPWSLFTDIKSMTYGIDGHVSCRISFDGEVYETEDQRNWTDASFKTYATPQSLPKPVLVEKDTVVSQKVTITFEGKAENVARNNQLKIKRLERYPNGNKLPLLGTCITLSESLWQNSNLEKVLLSAPFDFLRIDISSELDINQQLNALDKISNSYKGSFELACHLGASIEESIDHFKPIFKKIYGRICRILIIKENEKVISGSEFLLSKNLILNELGENIPIVSGTDHYFVELNRNKDFLVDSEEIFYSINPQVHTFDNWIILANLPGIKETIKTAQEIFSNKKIHLTPITLRPRKFKNLPLKDGGADLRQFGLFTAAWAFGCLYYAIEQGVDSVTFFELFGEAGLVDHNSLSISPVMHLFKMIYSKRSDIVALNRNSEDESVLAIEFKENESKKLAIGNMSEIKKKVEFKDYPIMNILQSLTDITLSETRTSERKIIMNGIIELRPFEIVLCDVG